MARLPACQLLVPGSERASLRCLVKPGPLALQRKRVEISSPIESVDPFDPLEPAYDKVGERSGNGFIDDLETVRRSDHDEYLGPGFDSPERDEDQDDRVHQLPADGGTDGTGPQKAPASEQFELGHRVAVGEFTGPVGGQTGDRE